ncbi:helix-turn-helix domain-containing protein [Halapricum salinum]|uniref:Transcriptional regulator n=1 Tax=Halapricum salinum TaxID=1457250 RepID=A0A4D6HDS1_9EURY|nr:helix-turn-helix domain-containing protein [Halapricum salinum]QCC51396.1 transcriptional regulator [Halapricum salinum]
MSYDTDHVRNAGRPSERIRGIDAFTDLVDNAALAGLYTSIRSKGTATGPELVDEAEVSKKTVYDYLGKLVRAGLITDVGEDSGASTYAAEDFEMTLTVRDVAVSITPELVEVLSHRDEYPVIDRVLEEHGLLTFALAHDLVVDHHEGDITIRQISELTGLSSGMTYDLVDAIYTIRGFGESASSPETYTPGDVDMTEK